MKLWVALLMAASPLSAGAQAFSSVATFERVWSDARSGLFSEELARGFFTTERHDRELAKARAARSVEELAPLINAWLGELHVSHTHFYTPGDLEFSVFNSMFTEHRIDRPRVHHLGLQGVPTREGRFEIRAVLDDSPAERAGLRRGDLISAGLEGGRGVYPDGRPRVLQGIRDGHPFSVAVTPVYESPQDSFLRAMRASQRVIAQNGRKLAYVHLWCGTDPAFARELDRYVQSLGADIDGLILDLRDGFGGAWYEYLDPFFADRAGFYDSTWIPRGRPAEVLAAEPIATHPFFAKPMAVLINEGVRSGKEAVAFQFKKSGRARLFGVTTAGYFLAGQVKYLPGDDGYLLYLAVTDARLDGQVIEGRGVSPDVEVIDSAEQLPAAIRWLSGL